MTMQLTKEKVQEILQEIVDKVGETYVYEQPTYKGYDEYTDDPVDVKAEECYYSTPDGAPGCLVGQLLAREFPEYYKEIHHNEWDETKENGTVPKAEPVYCLPGISLKFTDDALAYLAHVQNKQDTGTPWGAAIEQ